MMLDCAGSRVGCTPYAREYELIGPFCCSTGGWLQATRIEKEDTGVAETDRGGAPGTALEMGWHCNEHSTFMQHFLQ